jgi:multiple antibiotic resistance protein
MFGMNFDMHFSMNVEVFLNALISYLVIVNPFIVATFFHALTNEKKFGYSFKMALRAVMITMGIILLFGFFGEKILAKLGITVESFRIAGGMLLFYTSFTMITKKQEEKADTKRKKEEEVDISVFPLSIPLLAGPGCLTMTILLFSKSKGISNELFSLSSAVISICIITFFFFVFSKWVTRITGKVVNNVIQRTLGVVLASLSIQFIADGCMGMIKSNLPR